VGFNLIFFVAFCDAVNVVSTPGRLQVILQEALDAVLKVVHIHDPVFESWAPRLAFDKAV
jgi:hypothetical protein